MTARPFALGVLVLACAAACSSTPERDVPVAPAPPSRHGALRAALADEARAFPVKDGDVWGDLGDAPFFGLAWLARRAEAGELDAEGLARRDAMVARARALLSAELLDGDLQEKVMAALGLIEHVAASGDRAEVPVLDSFVDRLDSLVATFGDYLDEAADQSWAVRSYGPTSVTALVALVQAQYALLVGGPRGDERRDRAAALERAITGVAFGDLVAPGTGQAVRAYAFAPDRRELFLYPNVAMILLEARLFRLTRDEAYRLVARALYGAIQPLELSDAPTRYASPYAAPSLGVGPREVSTLSSHGYLALALSLLFEITGEARFSAEADRVFDGIEAMRGPYCASQVDDGAVCAPACGGSRACVHGTCEADRCATGLLHHVVRDRLAEPGDGVVFCTGCNLEVLYALGYRRALAGEPY